MKQHFTRYFKSLWITLRYGSPLTKKGRELRRRLNDPLTDEYYTEVGRPSA